MTAQVPIFYQALGMPPTSMAYIPAGRDFRQCVDAAKCVGDIVNGDRELGEFQATAASLFLALTGWERAAFQAILLRSRRACRKHSVLIYYLNSSTVPVLNTMDRSSTISIP
jgi:hypothetical protein